MSDISELESRISAAMDRIGRGIEALDAPTQAPPTDTVDEGQFEAEREAAQKSLDAEKLLTAQLEEQVKALHARQDALEEDLAGAKVSATQSEEALGTANAALEAAQKDVKAAQSEAEDAKADAAAAKIETGVAIEAAQKAAQDAEDAANQTPAEPTGVDLDANREEILEMAFRLRRLRRTGRQMRQTIAVLRQSVDDKSVDADAINRSLEVELQNITAEREADLAEMNLLIGTLHPLLEPQAQDADTSEGED